MCFLQDGVPSLLLANVYYQIGKYQIWTYTSETFHVKMSSACRFLFMQIKVIFIRMVLPLDSLWDGGTKELRNGLPCKFDLFSTTSSALLDQTRLKCECFRGRQLQTLKKTFKCQTLNVEHGREKQGFRVRVNGAIVLRNNSFKRQAAGRKKNEQVSYSYG